jgi:hypothetical protein
VSSGGLPVVPRWWGVCRACSLTSWLVSPLGCRFRGNASSWVNQAARNLVMDLQDAGCRARYLIRDRDAKFPELFDAILADVGITVVLTAVRMPRWA